jgi:hypothetical protein
MKKTLFFLLIAFNISNINAQHISSSNLDVLKSGEQDLAPHAIQIIQGEEAINRITSDSIFVKNWVKLLKTQHSFYYPFDSLITISRIYAPDSSFRIFTWQLVIDENTVRQHGAIQMNTADGSLKLFPLIDKSDVIENLEDTVTSNLAWVGAIYYKLIERAYKKEKFYTLIGYDENNIRSTKKIIEVLHFKDGMPVFGGGYFLIPNDDIKPHNHARYIMEYKKDASPKLNFDSEMNMIVMEHLISESNQPAKAWTMIGDGDYDGLKWKGGRWVLVPKIFDQILPEGKVPTPMPIRDAKGNIDDTKLKQTNPQ